jgi:hypothetical protein
VKTVSKTKAKPSRNAPKSTLYEYSELLAMVGVLIIGEHFKNEDH